MTLPKAADSGASNPVLESTSEQQEQQQAAQVAEEGTVSSPTWRRPVGTNNNGPFPRSSTLPHKKSKVG